MKKIAVSVVGMLLLAALISSCSSIQGSGGAVSSPDTYLPSLEPAIVSPEILEPSPDMAEPSPEMEMQAPEQEVPSPEPYEETSDVVMQNPEVSPVSPTIETETPEAIIRKFEAAYNALDINKVLDCIEPTYAKAIRGMTNILGGIVDVGIGDIIDILPLLNAAYSDGNAIMTIEILDTEISGERALVRVNAIFDAGDHEDKTAGTFELKKTDGKWYITNAY